MHYAFVFALFAATLLATAVSVGGPAWLLAWPALSFAVVACGYAGLGPVVVGKRANGRLGIVRTTLLLPYLLLTWAAWHLYRVVSRDRCCDEVAPGLWLGRRPLARDLPDGVTLVVDLTAEFWPARGVCAGRTYVTLPTLDADAPHDGRMGELISRIAAHDGPAYVHCALGRGRSALVVAAVLLARGVSADEGEAMRLLKRLRPVVRLTSRQRQSLRRFALLRSLTKGSEP